MPCQTSRVLPPALNGAGSYPSKLADTAYGDHFNPPPSGGHKLEGFRQQRSLPLDPAAHRVAWSSAKAKYGRQENAEGKDREAV